MMHSATLRENARCGRARESGRRACHARVVRTVTRPDIRVADDWRLAGPPASLVSVQRRVVGGVLELAQQREVIADSRVLDDAPSTTR